MPISAYTRSRASSSAPSSHARNDSASTLSTAVLTPAPSPPGSPRTAQSPSAPLPLATPMLDKPLELVPGDSKPKRPVKRKVKVKASTARRPATRLACQRVAPDGKPIADRPSPSHPYFPTYPAVFGGRTASGSTSRTASTSASTAGSTSTSPPPAQASSSTASTSAAALLPNSTLGYNPHTTLEQAAAELRAIKDRLGRWGMRAKEIKADGGCLFRALSDQMFGTQIHHLEIRHVVCNHLEHNQTTYAPYLVHADFGRSYAAYVTNMRKPGTWAGDMELAAFCRTFDRRVMVVHHDYIQQATEDPLPLPLASPRYIRTRIDVPPRSSDPLLQRLLTQPATPEDEVLVIAFHESGAHWWSSRKADGSGPGMREDVLESEKAPAAAAAPAELSLESGTPPSSIVPLETATGTSSQKSITSDMDVDAALVVEAGSQSPASQAPEDLQEPPQQGDPAVLQDILRAGDRAQTLQDIVQAGQAGKGRSRNGSRSSTGPRDARSKTAESGDRARRKHKGWVWEEVAE